MIKANLFDRRIIMPLFPFNLIDLVWQLQTTRTFSQNAQRDVTLDIRGNDTDSSIQTCLILSSNCNFVRLFNLESDKNQRQNNRKNSNKFCTVFPIRTIQLILLMSIRPMRPAHNEQTPTPSKDRDRSDSSRYVVQIIGNGR